MDKVHPGDMKSLTVEGLAEFMRGEIEEGCEGDRVLYVLLPHADYSMEG